MSRATAECADPCAHNSITECEAPPRPPQPRAVLSGGVELAADAEAFSRVEQLAEVYLAGGLAPRDAWASAIADYVCA